MLCTQSIWMHLQILLYLFYLFILTLVFHHDPLSRHMNRKIRRGISNLNVTQCETSMEGLVIMDYSNPNGQPKNPFVRQDGDP